MQKKNWKAWLYLLPAIAFLGVFMVYPLIDVFVYSFEEGYNSASQTFWGTGLYNYSYVLHDPYFLQAVKNTFILVIITVPVSTGLALLISLGLNSIRRLRDFFQTVFFLPYVTNTLAVGMVFMILFKKTPYSDGLINLLIRFFGGQSVDEDAFLSLKRKYGFVYIEDGAHVIGTTYKGRPNGSFADMTTLSFHAVKTITGGEGGAVVTNDENYYKKLLLYRTHGITRDPQQMVHEPDGPWYYEMLALAPNYRITDMQAALIESQLRKLPVFAARKKAIVRKYDEAFAKLPGLVLQQETEGSDTVRHLYILRLNKDHIRIDRRRFFEALAAENVFCNVHYIPVYYFPYYEKLGYKKGLCPNAEKLYDEMLTIPLYYAMSDQDVDDVIAAVTKIAQYYAV